MRPKHGRHSYKGTKFRKKDAGFNMWHFNDWYMEEFTPRFMV